MRLKTSQIAPVRAKLLKAQEYKCPLCGKSMKGGQKKPALDHDHATGYIRDVLCLNCNGMEGKVFNLARRCGAGNELEWITNWLTYQWRHTQPQHGGLFHPTHKTDEEKRIATNAKARKKRAAIKKG